MPETTVAAILTRAGHPDQVLLTRRNVEPYKGYWCIPGGHIDRYEPACEAVLREALEETGLAFDARFFGFFDEIIPDKSLHAVVLVFAGEARGQVRLQESEVQAVRWFTLGEARTLPLAFGHRTILAAFAADLSGRPRT
jgi:8-oxo-dGTP diphosphatase